jgi:uncharacterized protein (DUF58 family)
MSFVPSPRLLAWVGAAALPAAFLLVASAALWPLVVAVWAALALVALADAAAARRRARGLRVAVPALVRLTHEREGEIPVRIERAAGLEAGSQPALSLRVAPDVPPELEPVEPVLAATLGPGADAAALAYRCRPLRRGVLRVPRVVVECWSPLGLWSVRRVHPAACEVRAFPNLWGERKRVPALFLYRGHAGAHRQRQVGKGREFEKLREYVPGDSYEDVHWKATAKRGRPVTKLYQVERTQEVYAVLDTSRLSARPSGSGGPDEPSEPALERMVRAALVLALAAERQGDLFGMVAFGDRVRRFVRARSGGGHFQSCREALYALAPQASSPDFEELATFLRLRLRRRALLVFLTDLDDPVLAESFQRAADLLRRQHLLLVCTLRPPDVGPLFARPARDLDDVYRGLAGHLRWQDQRELGRAFERRGVGYASLAAASLSADVVSRYAALKQRQLL